MEENKIQTTRQSFSKIGAFLAIISSALGLGNIWKFPTMAGEYGGATFIFIFILFSFLVSLPVALIEFYIAHSTKQNPLNAFRKISNEKKFQKLWNIIPYLGVVYSILVVFYYADVIGWLLKYFISSISGALNVSNIEEATDFFNSVITSPTTVLFYQIMVFCIISSVMFLDIIKSIDKVIKFSVTVLLIILVLLCCYSLSMSGAGEAVKFLFAPNFSKLSKTAILNALGLAFFKISAGSTAQMVYFSHFPRRVDAIKTEIQCILADLGVSLLCGLVIFPIVFSYGFKPQAGSGLLFVIMPVALLKMKFGRLFLIAFFTLTLLVALGSLLSLMNVSNVFIRDRFNFSNKKTIFINLVMYIVLGSLVSLSTTPILDSVVILGRNLFDFFDFISSNVMLPISSLLMIIFTMYILKKEEVIDYMLSHGCHEKAVKIWYFISKYISLIIILTIIILGMI